MPKYHEIYSKTGEVIESCTDTKQVPMMLQYVNVALRALVREYYRACGGKVNPALDYREKMLLEKAYRKRDDLILAERTQALSKYLW
jgi:hypothetical protein